MSCTIEKIIADARMLVNRLKDHDSAADSVIGQATVLHKRVEAMKIVRRLLFLTCAIMIYIRSHSQRVRLQRTKRLRFIYIGVKATSLQMVSYRIQLNVYLEQRQRSKEKKFTFALI